MLELTQEEKIKIFEKLPKELQNLMQSEDTGAFLLYLGKKYNLTGEKVHQLSKLVGDIILGITPVTGLAQEINLKITTDSQVAMNLSQELYANLLAPVMAMLSKPTVPAAPISIPPAQVLPLREIPQRETSTDRYREPIAGPEIVDLRKAPVTLPPPIQVPPPLPVKPALPLTFTRPTDPPALPLIEAEPHLPVKTSPPPVEPQYIIRPPGIAPTDMPRNILDLKKDKGEF